MELSKRVNNISGTSSGNVVLITGGSRVFGNGRRRDSDSERSAEIFLPDSPETPCILPDLPRRYAGHTQDGGLLCGGLSSGTRTNCRQWNTEEGKFPIKPVHEFKNSIAWHVSWTSASKTYLFGGGFRYRYTPNKNSNSNITIITPGIFDGAPGLFNLTYPLYGACSIPDPEKDTVLITGGTYSKQTTSLYNVNGFVEYLSELNHQRKYHGCTSYFANQKRVFFVFLKLLNVLMY